MRLLKFQKDAEKSVEGRDIFDVTFEQFLEERPLYAIVSHRWRQDELTFDDIKSGTDLGEKQGWKKLQSLCAFTAKLQSDPPIQYIWMDTCCIDKDSSAELSEALNSMYRWYEEAAICLAYLYDVPSVSDTHPTELLEYFKRSEWFKRGWTLQELLAPGNVLFLTGDFETIGHKATISHRRIWCSTSTLGLPMNFWIAQVTGIPENVLWDITLAEKLTFEERQTWMQGRRATKVEDMAYCQLGLYGVFLSPIYGEREHAYERLHDAIELKKQRPKHRQNRAGNKSPRREGPRLAYAVTSQDAPTRSQLREREDVKNIAAPGDAISTGQVDSEDKYNDSAFDFDRAIGRRDREEGWQRTRFPPPLPCPTPSDPTGALPIARSSSFSVPLGTSKDDVPYSKGNRNTTPYPPPIGKKTSLTSDLLRRSASTGGTKDSTPPKGFSNIATVGSDDERVCEISDSILESGEQAQRVRKMRGEDELRRASGAHNQRTIQQKRDSIDSYLDDESSLTFSDSEDARNSKIPTRSRRDPDLQDGGTPGPLLASHRHPGAAPIHPNRSDSRERLTQRVMDKLGAPTAADKVNQSKREEYDYFDEGQSRERRRPSSKSHRADAESSLVSPNLGNTRVSRITLAMIEDTIKREITPMINAIKEDERRDRKLSNPDHS